MFFFWMFPTTFLNSMKSCGLTEEESYDGSGWVSRDPNISLMTVSFVFDDAFLSVEENIS